MAVRAGWLYRDWSEKVGKWRWLSEQVGYTGTGLRRWGSGDGCQSRLAIQGLV